MNIGNKVVLTRERNEQRDRKRRAKNRQNELARQERAQQAELLCQKQESLEGVLAAAARALIRLNADNGAGWSELGKAMKVCRRSGPHDSFWCFLHRKELAVVRIPGVIQSGRTGTWDYDDVDESHHERMRSMRFYLGADGYIYRDGRHKVYRAELMKRRRPQAIASVVPKLERIWPN